MFSDPQPISPRVLSDLVLWTRRFWTLKALNSFCNMLIASRWWGVFFILAFVCRILSQLLLKLFIYFLNKCYPLWICWGILFLTFESFVGYSCYLCCRVCDSWPFMLLLISEQSTAALDAHTALLVTPRNSLFREICYKFYGMTDDKFCQKLLSNSHCWVLSFVLPLLR